MTATASTKSTPLAATQRLPQSQHQSTAFQQVKQTQSSLARLSRARPQAHHQQTTTTTTTQSNVNNNSNSSGNNNNSNSSNSNGSTKQATFVDCLIRRFKDCFSEHFCEVPVFVVGNLSPGLDGSHLILPPCVSLSGQSICRFSTPKNLRVMNSLRDSCRSIEELDLGANKLNDLIEIYKILMLTPNLRFLNLSENDLSRTSPVACATLPLAASDQHNSASSNASSLVTSVQTSNYSFLQPFAAQYRTARSRSTLGQSSGVSSSVAMTRRRVPQAVVCGQSPPTASSTAAAATSSKQKQSLEARRLMAATAALAQSTKTSARSAAATVSAARASAAAAAAAARRQQSSTISQINSPQTANNVNSSNTPANNNRPSSTRGVNALAKRQPSTLHLARSLSSLTAADARSSRAAAAAVAATAATSKQTNYNNTTTAVVAQQHQQHQHQHQHQHQQANCYYRRTFDSIKALALNNTRCQWKTVCSILTRMPNLEELHLSLNNYERIELEPSEFKHLNLKRLYLCNNPRLTDWRELDKLIAAFPSLEVLSMADCAISQIPDNLDTAREWRKLCGLNITGWPIKEWPIIERLNALPSLVDLKCRNVQVLNEIHESRHHLIARLPKLQRLNGSEIEEREFAEKEFVRFFMANSHLERPIRFYELFQVHGQDVAMPVVDVDVDLSPPNTAQVRIVYINKNFYKTQQQQQQQTEFENDLLMSEDFLTKLMQTSDENIKQQQQKHDSLNDEQENNNRQQLVHKDDCKEVMAVCVDLRQSVRKFKTNLCSMFGLTIESTNDLLLYYIDHEMVGLMGPELLKHNQKKLWNYNVQDGDQFIVEKR